jgi:hypothetical protein
MPGLPVDSQSPDARPLEQQGSAIVLETGPESSANEPRPDESPTFEVDLRAFAALCTRLGRVEHADELQAIFQELAGLLSATGVIVWMWNEEAGELRPSLVHGYSARVVAQLPGVAQDADNVTAAAFRSNEPCAIAGTEFVNGALAVPLLTMDGCAGVLALELGRGLEATGSVRATATIFAALLAQLVGDAALGGFRHRGALAVPQVGAARRVLRVNARGDHARTPVRSSTGSPSRANAADRRRTAYSEKR